MAGDVLLQRAAEGDVEKLHAPADAQHGDVPAKHQVKERQLGLIAARVDAAAARLVGAAVVDGVDVASAAEDHRVHADDQRIERVQRRIVHHRHHLGADHLNGVQIVLRKVLAAVVAAVRQQADARDAAGIVHKSSSPRLRGWPQESRPSGQWPVTRQLGP